MDVVAGILEVGRTDDTHEVIIHYRDLKPDPEGGSQIAVSPSHARHFAYVLLKHAADAERESSGTIRKRGKSRMK
jgi:hypothetical protein